MKYYVKNRAQADLNPPFGFRESGGKIEGEVSDIIELLKKFEPIDVLEGAVELIDAEHRIITLHCDDASVLESNEYPDEYEGIFFTY